MVGWDDGGEEGDFSDALGDEFECIAVDEKCFRFLIDFEIENLLKKRVSLCTAKKGGKTEERKRTIFDTFSAINSPESSLTSSVLYSVSTC